MTDKITDKTTDQIVDHSDLDNYIQDDCCFEYFPPQMQDAQIGLDVLELASKCLTDTPYGRPTKTFMWPDEPIQWSPCDCDFLAIYPHTIRPIRYDEFPEEEFQTGFRSMGSCQDFGWSVRWELVLARPCVPIINEAASQLGKPEFIQDTRLWNDHTVKVMIDQETLSHCMLLKLENGYEIGGREWTSDKIFFQQLYQDMLYPCSRLRFRIMFNTSLTCIPKKDAQCIESRPKGWKA